MNKKNTEIITLKIIIRQIYKFTWQKRRKKYEEEKIYKKSCIHETMNISTDADSSTNTKTDRNGQKGQ